jgi:hypothetical protein
LPDQSERSRAEMPAAGDWPEGGATPSSHEDREERRIRELLAKLPPISDEQARRLRHILSSPAAAGSSGTSTRSGSKPRPR